MEQDNAFLVPEKIEKKAKRKKYWEKQRLNLKRNKSIL